ncbi:bifunctional 2-C-methyl-D-erythritol 4-phosphate cytidylyltransferase/2-C-methyl-D-erythritol 2,4-cyclodiphosphate synthase [Hasllibacter sp. MH4015]|uniref:bifunctional 2-C-methyl-D-erythritol 4-phosphate cytidylyltransferase/2-C-methyl-D-erythritol 2,4-cyclodiphosphate synthase n=1 Tax=Hasllibacter sp. MH4015 TaxID=2854029 RepID=UPI001CD66714|nr:bifunctional 2-C-methyl-D-erythritol 4-phosphate cytidylyltransferase/2-C-methyl-D-erythritol 2,4-cyclodiphosphate synthase [Hasllibacter sp. MH4015]
MDQRPENLTAVIVAAGRGTRAGGDVPKQWRAIAGRSVVEWTVSQFTAHPAGIGVVLVIHPDDASRLDGLELPSTLRVVHGGADRAASVRAGLAACPEGIVLIHDVARPCVSPEVISAVIDGVRRHGAAAPALAVTDALWRGSEIVEGTQDRGGLWRAQTPQGFGTAAIIAAHDAFKGAPADDVEVARAAGIEVAIVPGDEANLKITGPEDFARAQALLRGDKMDIRVGNGFDVHRFGPGDHVMLCGVAVPHTRGLQGHSDADVGLHTVTDAIYGALAEGDIGTHFPPTDPKWKGAESHIFLTHAVDLVAERGFSITHADLTLICEQPKIGPVAAQMRERLADLLRVDVARVSVKATTSERLGFTGREEGIAALANVTLVKT